MSHRADPCFLTELKKYGMVNIESCFNCGNCTAVCPLSTDGDSFPRRMIRYAQLGMEERILSSKELWLCYSCGECTTTCPRQAEPGEFMAAARRYAIARYDRLGIARLLTSSSVLSVLFLVVLAIALGLFIYSFHGPMPGGTLDLFAFIPSEAIHDWGVAFGIVVALAAVSGVVTMVRNLRRAEGARAVSRRNCLPAVWKTLATEVIGQHRYRSDCEPDAAERHWYGRKWFVHASMLWGFLGLFLATALDYLLALVGVKAVGTWVPIWYPIRLLGTLAGILLVYGVSTVILRRLRKSEKTYGFTTPLDWAFLVLLWLGGMTGFALELALYLPHPHAWNYWMLLAHLVVVVELFILLPFSHFAHIVYRSIALYIHAATNEKSTT
jgi:ferredoxin